MSREVKLPSGAVLAVNDAPFSESKALFQALMRELRTIPMSEGTYNSLLKDMFCTGFSSLAVEVELNKCMARCTYNVGAGGMQIKSDTFEDRERRQDYVPACVEVIRENVGPFVKTLSVEFAAAMAMMLGFLTPKAGTTTSSSSSGSPGSATPPA